MKLRKKKILIYGAGLSGISAVKLLLKQGLEPILYDGNREINIEEIKRENHIEENFPVILGRIEDENLNGIDLVIISPGVPLDSPDILNIKKKNIPIWGEIELAYYFDKGKIIGVTGTNGKTTTISLLGEIMKSYFDKVFVVGNIGKPYTDIVMDTSEDSITVVELSSFQLETIENFRPKISSILNISPDHLNRHHTMEAYLQAKMNIFKNQNKEDCIVLNYEDEKLRQLEPILKSKIVYFSSKRHLEEGLFIRGDEIIYKEKNIEKIVCDLKELKILGKHNYENIMAGAAIGHIMGVPWDYIEKSILGFKAVEHRIEYIGQVNNVDFYNDSKGTNPDASQKAIEAMERPIILIAGGYNKGGDFQDWIRSFEGRVKQLILIGETKEEIKQVALREGFTQVTLLEDLRQAVDLALDKSEFGDAVLLSPACASWDMFKSYEERGDLFRAYVHKIIEKV